MFKHYIVYLEDGENTYKIDVPAKNKADALKFVEGNGDIIAIKEGCRTEKDCMSIEHIGRTLRIAGYGQMEVDLITRALTRTCKFIGN